MTDMSDDQTKKAGDDLTDDWIGSTARLPEPGHTVQIRLAPQQEPPYDVLPSEVKAVFKRHWFYRTPQFTPDWRMPDGSPWFLYVSPSQITHWRYLETLPEGAPLRPPSPVIDRPPAIYTPQPPGTKRRYTLTPQERQRRSQWMRDQWLKKRGQAAETAAGDV